MRKPLSNRSHYKGHIYVDRGDIFIDIHPIFKTIFKIYWNLNLLYQSWDHKDMRGWRMSAYLHFYALTICILPDKQRLSFSFTLILRPPKQSSFVNQCACYVFNVEFNHHLWSFSCSFTTIRFSCKRNNSFDVTRMVIIWSWKFVFQMWHKEISCLYCQIQLTVFMDKTI